ncbi:MAG: hypothetical protein CMO47_00025, partial [Verrucomicrobiales bacterium]|nr:hypothetical protein [Verrucomicrobiales bacterium]
VEEYAEFLGIDPRKEEHLMWIAREGVEAPVPPPWKAVQDSNGDVYYFNFSTGESIWDHPEDANYRELVDEYRKKGKPPAGYESWRRYEFEMKSSSGSGALSA